MSEKLQEATILALQGKLLEQDLSKNVPDVFSNKITEDEDTTKRKRLSRQQKYEIVKDFYKKVLTIYAKDSNFVKFIQSYNTLQKIEMNLNDALQYVDSTTEDTEFLTIFKNFTIYLLLEWSEGDIRICVWHYMETEKRLDTPVYKVYTIAGNYNDPLDRKCPKYTSKDIISQKVTESSVQSDKNNMINIIDTYIQTNGNVRSENSINSNKLDKPATYKFTFYLNNATADRRETTREDIRNDWKTVTYKCTSDLEAFEYFYNNVLCDYEPDLDTLDSFYSQYNAKTAEDKLKAFDDHFMNLDLGEGCTILIKVQRDNQTIWDSNITKQDLLM